MLISFEQITSPCDNHQCKRGGKCVPNNKGGYTCKCKPGSKGRFCDQGETSLMSQMMVEDSDDLSNERTTNGIMLFS